MIRTLVTEGPYRPLFAIPGAQLILCCFDILQRWEHDELRSHYWRWYWNDRPGAVIRTRRETVALGPDRVVLIPSDTPFATETSARVGHLYMHFILGVRLQARFRAPIVQRPSAETLRLIRQLASTMQSDSDADRENCSLHFRSHSLVAGALAEIPPGWWEASVTDVEISRVLAAMHERPAAPLDNEALGRLASMNTRTLLRRFKRATGVTPHQYLCRLRVDNASIDLLTSNESIDAIARRNGFCDRYHLSRLFIQMLQVSPAAYRAGGRAGKIQS